MEINLKEAYKITRKAAAKYYPDTDERKDVVQDIIIKLWGNKDRYDRRCEGSKSLEALINTYVRNYAYDKHRQATFRRSRLDGYVYEQDKIAYNNGGSIIDNELIKARINTIPKKQQDVFYKKTEGYKDAEIAKELGISTGATKRLIFDIRKNIKNAISGTVKQKTQKQDPVAKQIIDLRQNPLLSIKDIARLTNSTMSKVQWTLDKAKKATQDTAA
jgi:RNA polymerase sigma factor (sigma-70 family)